MLLLLKVQSVLAWSMQCKGGEGEGGQTETERGPWWKCVCGDRGQGAR
jgi:hypothetical protein